MSLLDKKYLTLLERWYYGIICMCWILVLGMSVIVGFIVMIESSILFMQTYNTRWIYSMCLGLCFWLFQIYLVDKTTYYMEKVKK